MQDVPKTVLNRLPAAAAAEQHPDADLLAAFAEQSLAGDEHAGVMEHVARCGDCREVIALALPATEAVPVRGSVMAGVGWFSWPVLRWGVVAAGILLVASFGVLRYEHRQQQSASSASRIILPLPTEPTDVPRSSLSPQTSESHALTARNDSVSEQKNRERATVTAQKLLSADKVSSSVNSSQPAGRPSALAGANSGGGIGTGVFKRGTRGEAPRSSARQAFALAPPARGTMAAGTPKPALVPGPASPNAMAPAAEALEVQSEAPQIAQNQVHDELQNQRDLPGKSRSADTDVVKAKDLAGVQAGAQPSAPMGSVSRFAAPAALLASARWGISSEGALQRSFDAGKTWQNVDVSQAVFQGKLAMEKSTLEYKAGNSVKKDKKSQKEEVASPVVFRAVAALDADVWAGGTGAMLYHSADFGNHWEQILPSEAGNALTGEIIGVEFSGPQDGKITTSTNEVWITADGGQSWRKQQ